MGSTGHTAPSPRLGRNARWVPRRLGQEQEHGREGGQGGGGHSVEQKV